MEIRHPDRIWANVDMYDTLSGDGICGEWIHQDVDVQDNKEYILKEKVKALLEKYENLRDFIVSDSDVAAAFEEIELAKMELGL